MQRENHLLGEFHEKVVEELAADDEGTRTSSLELYEALNNISLDRNSSADPPPMFPQYSSSILPSRGPNVFGMDNDIGLFGVETSNSFPPALHSMPDLHRHHYNDIPRAAASFCTASNSSPDMQFPLERMMPSSYGMGMRKLDKSMRFLLNRQSVEKKGFQCELDMNLPFPAKLHYILSNPKYKDCVAWLPHGRAWRILKPKTFEKKVIPKFFRSFKYASFMRQVSYISLFLKGRENPCFSNFLSPHFPLTSFSSYINKVNGWAFNRITEGPDLNAYYHEVCQFAFLSMKR